MNFIVTGCSFTAGTIPLPHDDPGHWERRGSVWPHFLYSKMNTKEDKFLNLALPGAGNVAALSNLIYYLETNKPPVDQTTIGFNLTGLDRLDTIRGVNEPHNTDLCCIDTKGIVHPSKFLGFGWETSVTQHKIFKINILSCLTILQAVTYLDHAGYNYFFMLMNNAIYNNSPEWFKSVLDQRKNRWITFNGTIGMLEFARSNNLLISDSDWHPNTDGHKLIASYVTKHLNNHE
jgi:hypothetical protein